MSAVVQVIGVLETLASAIPAEGPGGDANLGETLARLAGKAPTATVPEPIRRRANGTPRTTAHTAVVTADKSQLVADLQADFERLMRTQRPIYLPAS